MMGKYNKYDKVQHTPKTSQYARFCNVCRRVTYAWICCGERTRRLNMDGNNPTVLTRPTKDDAVNYT